jgi:anti-sigma regulatory factor (Ser/Thr protein kinase)
MDCIEGVARKPWSLPFVAQPEEVAALRRIMRLHLGLWGLHDVVDSAQLCVSELVSNVINHVGAGTPTTLVVSMTGTRLRIEVHDPKPSALPTLHDATTEAESGRGMSLVSAVADRWGVETRADHKVTWCELATALTSMNGHVGGSRVARAEAMLGLYRMARFPLAAKPSPLAMARAEEAAIALIADLLHWVRAHGRDADEALDRAHTAFETGTTSKEALPS